MQHPLQPALGDSVNNLSAQGIDTWRAVRGGLYSVDAFAGWPTSRPETPRTQAPVYYDSPLPISTPLAAIQLANEKADNVGPAITPLADGAPSVPVDVAELGAFAPVHDSSTGAQCRPLRIERTQQHWDWSLTNIIATLPPPYTQQPLILPSAPWRVLSRPSLPL